VLVVLTVATEVREERKTQKACCEVAGGGITAIRDQESRVARNKVESGTLIEAVSPTARDPELDCGRAVLPQDHSRSKSGRELERDRYQVENQTV
jgi:hypothetical protein